MAYRNGPKIITDGLVLCLDAAIGKSYPGSGTTWYDLSTSNINGTLTNGPFFNSANRGYFNFDGGNESVKTGNFNLDFGTNSFTLAAWVRTSNNTQRGKIINKGQSVAFPLGSIGYSIKFYDRATFSVSDANVYTNLGVVNVSDFPNNVWMYFVGVYNKENSTQYLYLNGQQNNTASIAYGSISNPNAELTIGSLDRGPYGATTEYFNGNIAQPAIYNRALTSDEITQNFNATRGRFGV